MLLNIGCGCQKLMPKIEMSVIIFLCRLSDFNGRFTAYGAGNDNNLATIKAGSGTVIVFEGLSIFSKQIVHLEVLGNTDTKAQEQTRTLLSGETNADFEYKTVTLTGTCMNNFEFKNLLQSTVWLLIAVKYLSIEQWHCGSIWRQGPCGSIRRQRTPWFYLETGASMVLSGKGVLRGSI